MKIKKSDLDKIIREEFDLMNGNGSAYGLPSNWASKVMPEFEVELEEEQEAGVEALQELGVFLANLANEGYTELAEDLDEILGKIRNAGLLAEHPDAIQEGLDESDWGGFGGSKRVAPLDTYADPNDEGAMSYEEQLQFFEFMVNRGDRDPHEVLNYPEHFQNGLSFPDLGEDDVEDILSKLGLPEMNDPKWQRHTIGQKAVREGQAPIDPYMVRYVELAKEMVSNGVKEQKIDPQLADEILSMLAGVEGTGGFGEVSELFGRKKKDQAKPMSVADELEKAVDLMTRDSDCFSTPEGNGLNYVIWGLYDDPFDGELYKLGRAFTERLKQVAHEYRSKEDTKLTAQEDSLTERTLNALSEEFYNSLKKRNNK